VIEGRLNFLPAIAALLVASACSEPGVLSDGTETIDSNPAMQLSGRVVDEADLLDSETEAILTSKLERLELESGPQFVIATTKNLGGVPITEYSLNLARSWEIGDESRDDGVILLIAPTERKVRIEVGYGLEGSLSDPFCAKVIRENLIPAFTEGEMERGIIAGVDRLIEKMRLSPTININDNDSINPQKGSLTS